MAIYTISDVHVKNDGENLNLLMSFLSQKFQAKDSVYLLGDIFDLMIGSHQEYRTLYKTFFSKIAELKNGGIDVQYFEGNHDFHLTEIFNNLGIKIHTSPFVKIAFGKRILFCHGDDIELNNPNYVLWKRFVTSRPLKFAANRIFTFKFLDNLGSYLSKKSRNRNKNRYGNPQENLKIRDGFREAARVASKKYQVQTIICGHSHFQDNYSEGKLMYGNNGYVPYTKSYLKITDKIEILQLS